jgi:hypothetical protein
MTKPLIINTLLLPGLDPDPVNTHISTPAMFKPGYTIGIAHDQFFIFTIYIV